MEQNMEDLGTVEMLLQESRRPVGKRSPKASTSKRQGEEIHERNIEKQPMGP